MTYPGEENSDEIGRALAKKIAHNHLGWIVKDNPNKPDGTAIKGIDLLIFKEGKKYHCGFLEVELAKGWRFDSGEYRSKLKSDLAPDGVVTIPFRKKKFFQLPNSWWMNINEPLTHYILLEGRFVLENYFIERNKNKFSGEYKEPFLALPKEKVIIYTI